MHMHVFVFHFLNVWMTKIMLSTDLNYFSFKATILTSFFSKNERKTKTTLCDFEFKIAYDTWNTINSNQIQWKNCNRLWKRGRFFSLMENDTCDTFKSKDDSSIKLLFAKENCKWRKIHKNIHNSLKNGGWIMQRKQFSTVVYWSQTAKLLNKAEDNEEKTKIWRQKESYLMITPVT